MIWDLTPIDGPAYQAPNLPNREAILALFDANVAEAHESLAHATNEQLNVPWSLAMGGQTLFTMPRYGVISHLGDQPYNSSSGPSLRLPATQDVPVPSIYGPSGDEQ